MIDYVKVQPHLFIVNLATIGAFLDLFGADFGVGVRLKKKLGPTYANNQLWFWKYSPIFF